MRRRCLSSGSNTFPSCSYASRKPLSESHQHSSRWFSSKSHQPPNGSSSANFPGTAVGDFLFSSPNLWQLSELLYHLVATATPAPVGSESQPGVEKEFRKVTGIFQVAPSLGTLTFTTVRAALCFCYHHSLQNFVVNPCCQLIILHYLCSNFQYGSDFLVDLA